MSIAMDRDEPIQLFEFDCSDELSKPKIRAELGHLVERLLANPAVQKYHGSRKHEITFAEACRFWSLDESMRGERLAQALDGIIKNLLELNRIVTVASAPPVGNRAVTSENIRLLCSVFFYLEKRFERHLGLLRGKN
jgi:hypothetical protein